MEVDKAYNMQQLNDIKRHTDHVVGYTKKVQYLYLYIVQPFLMIIPMSKTINIEEKIYDTMQQEATQCNETLKTHVEKLLCHQYRKKDLLNKVFKGLEVEKDENTRIILKDLEQLEFYVIDVLDKGSKLYCKQCKSQNCKHTSFVWTQFENLNIWIEKSNTFKKV